jgi:Acetyltransferases
MLGVVVLRFDRAHRYGIVEDIVVDERARGRGVGTRLMRAAQAEMRAAGMEHAILESGIRNASAHAFFRREGYREAAIMFLKRLGD